MEIVNRDANFRSDTCQRVNSDKAICGVLKHYITMLCEVFEELKINNDVKVALSNIKERNLAKRRVLKKEENGGFALITGVTVLGTIGLGMLIFTVVKFILAG